MIEENFLDNQLCDLNLHKAPTLSSQNGQYHQYAKGVVSVHSPHLAGTDHVQQDK